MKKKRVAMMRQEEWRLNFRHDGLEMPIKGV